MEVIQNIFRWFDHYDGKSIRIISDSRDCFLQISNSALPHLLGLHYINKDTQSMRGIVLYNYIKNNHFTDREIYSKILASNGNIAMLNVQKRVGSFRDFMENIESCFFVDKTSRLTKIRSNDLLIDDRANDVRHLCILNVADVCYLQLYDIDRPIGYKRNVTETYIVQGNDRMYAASPLKERVKALLFYDEAEEMWRRGSFDIEKDKKMESSMVLESSNGHIYDVIAKSADNYLIRRQDGAVMLAMHFDPERRSWEHLQYLGSGDEALASGIAKLAQSGEHSRKDQPFAVYQRFKGEKEWVHCGYDEYDIMAKDSCDAIRKVRELVKSCGSDPELYDWRAEEYAPERESPHMYDEEEI